jgi:hypothetical protein
MTTTFKNSQERAWHIQHMRSSVDLLLAASKDWSKADAERGERTIKQLERQIFESMNELPATQLVAVA